MDKDTSVKVAVRIRPLSSEEAIHEPILCLDTIPEGFQVINSLLGPLVTIIYTFHFFLFYRSLPEMIRFLLLITYLE